MISSHCTSMREGEREIECERGRERGGERERERERGPTVSLYLVLITSIYDNQQRGIMALV